MTTVRETNLDLCADHVERTIRAANAVSHAGLVLKTHHDQLVSELREALQWYEEQAAGCRKVGSFGEPYQQALDKDGGKRARAALSKAQGE